MSKGQENEVESSQEYQYSPIVSSYSAEPQNHLQMGKLTSLINMFRVLVT